MRPSFPHDKVKDLSLHKGAAGGSALIPNFHHAVKAGDCLCPQGVVALGAHAHPGSLDKGRLFTFKFFSPDPGSEASAHAVNEGNASAGIIQYCLGPVFNNGFEQPPSCTAEPHDVMFSTTWCDVDTSPSVPDTLLIDPPGADPRLAGCSHRVAVIAPAFTRFTRVMSSCSSGPPVSHRRPISCPGAECGP